MWTAGREQDQDLHQELRVAQHTRGHRRTQTTCHPHDTDQIALIVIVPMDFVRFLCHLETRQSGLRRQWNTIICTLKREARWHVVLRREGKKGLHRRTFVWSSNNWIHDVIHVIRVDTTGLNSRNHTISVSGWKLHVWVMPITFLHGIFYILRSFTLAVQQSISIPIKVKVLPSLLKILIVKVQKYYQSVSIDGEVAFYYCSWN